VTLPSGLQRVEWENDGRAEVASVEQLDRLLDDLTEQARPRPFMAVLISGTGDSLAIGLGRKESVLSWVSATGDPPYHGSNGDPSATGLVVFFYGGSWSEFPRSYAVPVADARAAAREFFETGVRPNQVGWEEV
jgi:hypothetical protein